MSNQTTINLQEKRDFGQVINTTFSFVRLSFKSMAKDLLLIAGPFFILTGVLSAMSQMNHTPQLGKVNTAIFSSWEYLFSVLFSIVSYALATVIVVNYILDYKESGGKEFNKQEIRNNVKEDLLKTIFTMLVYGLLVMLASLLFVIPGIYFSLALSLAVIIRILNKDMGMGAAFKESRRLIKGNWWKTFGLFFIITLIFSVLTMVFLIPAMITNTMIVMNSARGESIEQYSLLNIILTGLGHFGYVLTIPIPIVAAAVYYYSLKETKDAVSLNEKIDMLGAAETSVKKEDEGSY